MLRACSLAVLPLLLATSVGCKQLMKSSDEFVDVGRRGADDALDLGRRADANPFAPGKVGGAVVKAAAQVGAEEALELAKARGVTAGADLPDLDGTWTQEIQDLGDGMSGGMTIDRKALGGGAFEVHIVAKLTVDGELFMTTDTRGYEVLTPTHQCQFVNTMELSFASEAVKMLVESAGAMPTAADLNDEPCDEITELSADRIHAPGPDGFTEIRQRG